jgi:murein L,D-transpeptidase YafK
MGPRPCYRVRGLIPTRRAALLGAASFVLCRAPDSLAQTAEKADSIVIFKAQRELRLMREGRILKSYAIALGPHPKGSKRRRGDGRTPEGFYFIDGRNARSIYHRSLHISYPNENDQERARRARVDPGKDVVIHGMPNRYGRHDPAKFFRDWTDGCIAVGSIAIEEIWDRVDDGTPVEIRP